MFTIYNFIYFEIKRDKVIDCEQNCLAPGIVDADYRGEIGVILVNLSNEEFLVKDGERIAQLVIAKHEQITWKEVSILDKTKRGEGGFGSTGV